MKKNKMKKSGIGFAFIIILALTLAIVIPVSADYTADHPLTTYAREKIRGDLTYTIGDSEYMGEMSPSDVYTVDFELDVPESSNVKMARLYAYWTGSHAGEEGAYPEMEVTFDRNEVKLDREYRDRKGEGEDDYPGGTHCYDLTDDIRGSGVYIVTIENSAEESRSFSMIGLVLLLIYEDENGEELEYWINEGCDMLYTKGIEHAEDAVTTANFGGKIDTDKIKSAKLLTIVPSGGDKGDNALIFNEWSWDRVYAGDPYDELAIDERDVTDYVVSKDNMAKIEDDGDYLVPSGAFLTLRYKEEEEKPSPVITPTPALSPTATPTPSVSVASTTPTPVVETPTPTPTPSPLTPTPSGFEAVFAVAGVLVLTIYHMRRNK